MHSTALLYHVFKLIVSVVLAPTQNVEVENIVSFGGFPRR